MPAAAAGESPGAADRPPTAGRRALRAGRSAARGRAAAARAARGAGSPGPVLPGRPWHERGLRARQPRGLAAAARRRRACGLREASCAEPGGAWHGPGPSTWLRALGASSCAPAAEAHRGNERPLRGSAPACGQRLRRGRGGAWRAGAAPGAGLPRAGDFTSGAEEEKEEETLYAAGLLRGVISPRGCWA